MDVSSTPVYFQELFWRNGDIDAEIFPHIRCRLPSLHLYLAPLLTFPSGCSPVVRDYWQPSSCSPALSFSLSICLFPPLSLCLSHCQHSAVELIRMCSLLPPPPPPENIVQESHITPKVSTFSVRADGKSVKCLAAVCTIQTCVLLTHVFAKHFFLTDCCALHSPLAVQ